MSGDHPYRGKPDRAFWSRSVSANWNEQDLVAGSAPLIRAGELVASAGSCFAANIVAPLEAAGFTYLRAHRRHPAFARWDDDNFGYHRFSAAYGNIYTARQLLQLLRRAKGEWSPREDRWREAPDRIVDPFRPGLRYPAQSDREFDALSERHLAETRQVFADADVFVFTLGLTEAWRSLTDGAIFPACPGTVAGRFDENTHGFHNFSVLEVVSDLSDFVREVRAINPGLRVILTVSPVPLVATATDDHVLNATLYSKSVLRAAAGEVAAGFEGVSYFPAYEIITGPQAPSSYFETDRRSPSETGIAAVMKTLLSACDATGLGALPAKAPPAAQSSAASLSASIAAAECEEAMVER